MRRACRHGLPSSIALILLFGGCVATPHGDGQSSSMGSMADGEWPTYGNDPGGTRYSQAAQIHRGNVDRLRVAWTYRTGELAESAWAAGRMAFEATPILVDDTLYLSTPFARVIALDPETGAERWTFDPKVDRSAPFAVITSRGVSTWLDPAATAGQPCRRRIFVGTLDARLIALDALTGAPCPDFGHAGEVNLAEGIAVGRDCRCMPLSVRRQHSPQRGTPYLVRIQPLTSPAGIFCSPPPWGTLAAVDLTSGDVRWEVPLGTISKESARSIPGSRDWGSPNMGGALTTAGGLVFVAAARDTTFRAFDVETGKILWEAELPASAQATPMTYRSRSGRQFVVIAAGGHGVMETKLGDHVVAFALPASP